jgi:hypothetical protein
MLVAVSRLGYQRAAKFWSGLQRPMGIARPFKRLKGASGKPFHYLSVPRHYV